MAVDSASQDGNLILAAACGRWGSHRCARLSFAWSVLCCSGFRESLLKGKLLPGRCFGAMRFDRHARHIRPLEKHSLSDFRLKCNAGAWMATMLHLVLNWNYFFAQPRQDARGVWFTSEARSCRFASQQFSRQGTSASFLKREGIFSSTFWDDVLRESFLTMMFTWVDCKLMMNTCKIGAKWSW